VYYDSIRITPEFQSFSIPKLTAYVKATRQSLQSLTEFSRVYTSEKTKVILFTTTKYITYLQKNLRE